MNLDERLEQILSQSDGGDVRISYPDGRSEIRDAKVLLADDIKHLIRQVIAYVTPDGNKPIPTFPLKDGEPPEITGFQQGFSVAIVEMEARAKELGL